MLKYFFDRYNKFKKIFKTIFFLLSQNDINHRKV